MLDLGKWQKPAYLESRTKIFYELGLAARLISSETPATPLFNAILVLIKKFYWYSKSDFFPFYTSFSECKFLQEFRKNVKAINTKQIAVGMDSLAKELALYSTANWVMYPKIAKFEMSKIIMDRVSFTNFNLKSVWQ